MEHCDFVLEAPLKNCVACDSPELRHAFVSPETDWSIPGFNIDRCESCGTNFVNPRPDSPSLVKFYNSINNRFPNHTKTSLSYYISLNRRKEFVQDYLSPILRFKGGGKHFDFGAGAGWLIRLTQDLGFESEGVDLVEENVRVGQAELGLKGLKYGDMEEIPPKKYDVFTAFSTMEHLSDPYKFARCAFERTGDDGIFAVVYPDLDSIMAQKMGQNFYWVMSPYHLTLFTRKGVVALLTRAGFPKLSWFPIQRSWKWTYALVHKMGLLGPYYKWRQDPNFVAFDIAVDNLFDEIAKDLGHSSNMMIICQKSFF